MTCHRLLPYPVAMADSAPTNATAPRLCVGITGHRLDRLGAATASSLIPAIDQLLAAIEAAAGLADRSALRLISGLADGADSITADCAAARGWSVDAVLPFLRTDYARDFADAGAKADYFLRLEACGSVMELTGARADSHSESVAYERAGRVLLSQCDILIALWDGGPVRGRGGAAQIVTEAVHQDVPVIHIDPEASHPPILLWDGLEELALGQDTIDTVAHGSLDDLPALVRRLIAAPQAAALDGAEQASPRWTFALAYPLLLMATGVRRLRMTDLRHGGSKARALAEIKPLLAGKCAFHTRLAAHLAPRFVLADTAASRIAQLFRHVYVSNFAFAAMAVLLSLLGLALPSNAKPVLLALELAIIAAILINTRRGHRAGWHRRWLDNRALAERLRCLAVSAQLGDLNLRGAGENQHDGVASLCRATARSIGLPSAIADEAYLAGVRSALLRLVTGQSAYLVAEARQMHRLEHRLHLLGTVLFAATALTCIGLLLFKVLGGMLPGHDALSHPATIAATIISAALPAFGAAIYGIRMQGDFSGSAERAAQLAEKLAILRRAIDQAQDFDALGRCARSATSLLTADVASWLHTTRARPLALPG